MDINKLIENFILYFVSILWEAMPFIVLGAIIAGILEEMLPQSLVAKLLPRSRTLAILIGGLLGLIFPMCECGIVPVMRRLLRKGLPLSCCTAYLLAGPIINVVVILSTMVAFSGQETITTNARNLGQFSSLGMTSLRVGLGYLVAVITSLVVDRVYAKYGSDLLTPLARPTSKDEGGAEVKSRPSVWKRLDNISETALGDFLDITAFLIIGALLAATVRVTLSHETIAELSHQHIVLSILLMMALAILLCLCSEADAFFAASFTMVPPAAKLAFLVLGPMMDLKLYMLYTRVFKPRLIVTIFGTVMILVFISSLVVHYIWQTYYLPGLNTAAVAAAAP